MKSFFAVLCICLGLAIQTRAESPASRPDVEAKTVVAPPTESAAVENAWPQELSDLKADPHAVWGRLDNGLRYVILPNREAPGRASLQLYMRVGSLMEAEDQRGMAHFLEHMAFNGTKRFPAGEMVEYFQRLGMSFGPHTNAATLFDKTVYRLELPRTDDKLTAEGLKLFRDVLDGMLLDKTQIERERKVILAEILARNSVEYRASAAQLTFLFPEALPPRRMPLGDNASVRTLAPQRFADFYETWYTPERAVIVAVGDFQVKALEALIRREFDDAKARRGEQPDPPLGKINAERGPTASLHFDPDASGATVDFYRIAADANAPDTLARRRQELARGLSNRMLNSRFQKLAAAKDAPFYSAGIGVESLFHLAQVDSLSIGCQPSQWKAALGVAEQELRRALTFGYSDTEFAEAKATFHAAAQAEADQADTRPASATAVEIIDSLAEKQVFTNPADDLALVKRLLASVTKGECEQAQRKAWDSPDVRILVQGNVPLAGDGAEQILAAYRASCDAKVLPPSDDSRGRFAYTNFGAPGQIVKQTKLNDLDFVEATFANNVRVNVKRTPFEKDRVRVLIRFGGGFLELPPEKLGLNMLANDAFVGGGLKAHSLTELNRLLADKVWSLGFGVGEDAFQLGGSCATTALETELQVCTAYLSAPGFREEARKPFLDCLDARYAQVEHTPEGTVASAAYAFLRSDDPRFRFPPREIAEKLTLDDLRNWLAEPLASGYMEVAIVGDIDPETALQLAAKTVGTLPRRAESKPAFAKARQVKFPAAPKLETFHFTSAVPRALSVVAWPTPGGRDVSLDRRVSVLTAILNDRLRVKVRQELGATYTPEVLSFSSDAFPDYGFVLAALTVEPKQTAALGPLVAKITANLAAGPISDDEFQRAIKPVLSSLDEVAHDNGYWVTLLGHCQEQPVFLDAARGRKADYESITKPELESLAKQLFAVEKATIIGMIPTPPSATGP